MAVIKQGLTAPGEQPEAPLEAVEEVSEAVTIPKSILGGKEVAPGDTVMLKVTSVDDDAGVIGVEYATEEATPAGGVESMAAEFD